MPASCEHPREHQRGEYRYLRRIDSPADLKAIPERELPDVCAEIRDAIIARCEAVGGHVGSNLGAIEATVAMHYVFDSPRDRIVFDVSHQSYTHKILTGRARAFTDPAHYGDASGFTNPDESEHDLFAQGHTGASISLACGLAKARDLTGGSDAWRREQVVAFIGDGSLSSGIAYEGLNEAGELNTGLVIIVNDNAMSITPDHGGMYEGFAELRRTRGRSPRNLFRDLGLDYRYVEDGNDVHALIAALREARGLGHPVVVHIHTAKGLGLDWAMEHREAGHWQDGADEVPEGAALPKAAPDARKQYGMAAMDLLLERIRQGRPVMVVSPATPGSNGITPAFRKAAGAHYIDTGITEQHALAFAAGLARGGARPVVGTSATFLQRAYDQFHQELGLNRAPVTVLMFQTGLSGTDMTHQGMFDIPMLCAIPGLTCLAPASMEEFLAMVDWATAGSDEWRGAGAASGCAASGLASAGCAASGLADGGCDSSAGAGADRTRDAVADGAGSERDSSACTGADGAVPVHVDACRACTGPRGPVVIQVPSRVLHESDYAARGCAVGDGGDAEGRVIGDDAAAAAAADLPGGHAFIDGAHDAPDDSTTVGFRLNARFGMTADDAVASEDGAAHAPRFLRPRFLRRGSRVAILGLGDFLPLALDVADALRGATGVEASVIDPRVFSSLDVATLEGLRDDHELVVTLENGSIVGGFGEQVAAYYGPSAMRVMVRGGGKAIMDRVPLDGPDGQLARWRLTPALLAEDIAAALG